MIESLDPIAQAFLGTLFTWGLTALGAAVVFLVPRNMSASRERTVLDGALGFASGVMLAASYWSLLAPAIEAAESSGSYGAEGEYAFAPVSIGFALGAVFVLLSDYLFPDDFLNVVSGGHAPPQQQRGTMAQLANDDDALKRQGFELQQSLKSSTRRVLLLVLAVTIHNFPEGLAVGVAFGSIGKTTAATFASAKTLTYGIGLQNFPEGLAVSLPLLRLRFSRKTAFFYGQLSGLVEPIGGLMGAGLLLIVEPLLPYALAFAAGAMVYVVANDLIPEAHEQNPRLSSCMLIVGFIVMMSMDVGLG